MCLIFTLETPHLLVEMENFTDGSWNEENGDKLRKSEQFKDDIKIFTFSFSSSCETLSLIRNGKSHHQSTTKNTQLERERERVQLKVERH